MVSHHEEHEHDDPICNHLDCAAGRIAALRVAAFIGGDDVVRSAVACIMESRDVGYVEASAWMLAFLTEAMEERVISEITSTVDAELEELTADE